MAQAAPRFPLDSWPSGERENIKPISILVDKGHMFQFCIPQRLWLPCPLRLYCRRSKTSQNGLRESIVLSILKLVTLSSFRGIEAFTSPPTPSKRSRTKSNRGGIL